MTTLLLLHLGGALCLFCFALSSQVAPGLPLRPLALRCAGAALAWEVLAAAHLAAAFTEYRPRLKELFRR